MTTTTREEIIRMAREVEIEFTFDPTETPPRTFVECWMEDLERFFKAAYAAVAAAKDEEHKEAMRWDVHSCGPTCNRYACVATRKAVAVELERCITELERNADKTLEEIIAAIRARGITPDSQHPN